MCCVGEHEHPGCEDVGDEVERSNRRLGGVLGWVAVAGQSVYFQFWYRDQVVATSTPTSNFSNAVEVALDPPPPLPETVTAAVDDQSELDPQERAARTR